MPRRREIPKREVPADPIYNSPLVTKFISTIMRGGKRSTADAVREPLLEQIRESHCGMLPDSQMPAMLAVQQQRDRRMAERLLAAPAPAMLFAGAFHVRRDLGVPGTG